jgi:hypothetical protein
MYEAAHCAVDRPPVSYVSDGEVLYERTNVLYGKDSRSSAFWAGLCVVRGDAIGSVKVFEDIEDVDLLIPYLSILDGSHDPIDAPFVIGESLPKIYERLFSVANNNPALNAMMRTNLIARGQSVGVHTEKVESLIQRDTQNDQDLSRTLVASLVVGGEPLDALRVAKKFYEGNDNIGPIVTIVSRLAVALDSGQRGLIPKSLHGVVMRRKINKALKAHLSADEHKTLSLVDLALECLLDKSGTVQNEVRGRIELLSEARDGKCDMMVSSQADRFNIDMYNAFVSGNADGIKTVLDQAKEVYDQSILPRDIGNRAATKELAEICNTDVEVDEFTSVDRATRGEVSGRILAAALMAYGQLYASGSHDSGNEVANTHYFNSLQKIDAYEVDIVAAVKSFAGAKIDDGLIGEVNRINTFIYLTAEALDHEPSKHLALLLKMLDLKRLVDVNEPFFSATELIDSAHEILENGEYRDGQEVPLSQLKIAKKIVFRAFQCEKLGYFSNYSRSSVSEALCLSDSELETLFQEMNSRTEEIIGCRPTFSHTAECHPERLFFKIYSYLEELANQTSRRSDLRTWL